MKAIQMKNLSMIRRHFTEIPEEAPMDSTKEALMASEILEEALMASTRPELQAMYEEDLHDFPERLPDSPEGQDHEANPMVVDLTIRTESLSLQISDSTRLAEAEVVLDLVVRSPEVLLREMGGLLGSKEDAEVLMEAVVLMEGVEAEEVLVIGAEEVKGAALISGDK